MIPSHTGRRFLRAAGPLLLALLGGALAGGPLFANSGFLITRGGGDSPFLLLRLHQLLAALGAGEFPARWMPDAAYGYGFPFFSYYAALPYYLAALLRAYGFTYVLALKLTQHAALLAAAGGAYAWARAVPGGWPRARAVLAAFAFTFAPFHLVNVYVRGDSLSELWAMAFFPWLLWALQRCLRRPSLGRAFAVALLAGGLTFTHNISALTFMPFAALYVVVMGTRASLQPSAGRARSASLQGAGTLREGRGHAAPGMWPVVVAGLALAWGLGLAAFFWVPALGEAGAVQIRGVTDGYFFYGNHFRGLDLVQRTLVYSAEVGPGRPTPFAMGLVQALLAGLGLLAGLARAARARRWMPFDTYLLLAALVSTWMVTPLSAWAWAHLPLLAYAQFPWRFLSIQSLFVALIIAHLVPASPGPRVRWGVALAASAALAIAALGGLRPDFIPLRDDDVTAGRLHLLEYFSANLGSTIGYEYLPRDVAERPFTSEAVLGRAPVLKVLSGTATGQRLAKRGTRETWTVAAPEPAVIALPTYDWPGWRARVDGQPVPVRAAPSLGWITLDVPAGAHTVTLALGRTPLRAAAEAASVVLLLVPGAWWVYRRRVNRPPRPPSLRRPGVPIRQSAWVTLGLLAGAVVLRLLPEPRAAGPLSMDFVQLTYPHHDTVTFAGGTELLDVSYSDDTPARGETVTVRSTWRTAETVDVRFELQPASNLLNAVTVVIDQAGRTLPPSASVAHDLPLRVPADIPPGVYFVTVSVASSQTGQPRPALTPNGRERGPVHLAPIVVDDLGAPMAGASLAAFGPDIDLLSAELVDAEPAGALLKLAWSARRALPASYVLAIRLRDAGGLEWSGLDAQAAYGYYPTSLWRAGEAVPDFYGLALPAGAPPGNYALSLDLRDPATDQSLGRLDLTRPLSVTTPIGSRQPRYSLLPALALDDVQFPAAIRQGDAPEMRLGWLALAAPASDYRARWTLTPIGSDQPPVTQVLDLAPGSRPSRWPPGTYVLGRVRLGTAPDLAPGDYALSLQIEDAAGRPAGQAVAIGVVQVTGRPRSFEVPPVQVPVGAAFGGVLKLWGYDEARDAGALQLTLVWSALDAPGRDYKYFVHLFNQADGFVAAQVDSIPRDFTYPTVLWLPGEVVTDTVTLPLADLAPGQYGVAVGWYDPAVPGLPRLAAVDAAGAPLAQDRVVLPSVITAP